MNLKTFLAAASLYRKTFVLVTATVLAVGLTGLLLAPTKYVSTTQLLVAIQGSTTANAYQNDDVVAGRVNSYIALLTSDVVSQRVIDKLGLRMTAPEFAAKISATNVPPKTAIIDVAVTDESAEQARRYADTLGKEFVSYTDALETPTGEDDQKVHASVVTAASDAHSRVDERVILGVLVALAALLLGAVAVWIRSLIDPVVRTADRAAAAAAVPVLGWLTSGAAASAGDLEPYRRLRTRLRATVGTDGGRVLEIASTDGEVDVRVVANNLGRAMELGGSRSIVLDAGFPESGVPDPAPEPERREEDAGVTNGDAESGQHNEIGRHEDNGTDWPEPEHRPDGFPDTLPVGAWAIEPDLIATEAAQLIGRLASDYEQIIIAAPPILSTITASVLSDYADAVLLVVSAGTTVRRGLSRAAGILNATGAPLIGVVVVGQVDGDAGVEERQDAELLDSEASAS